VINFESTKDKEIAHLKEQLEEARWSIIGLSRTYIDGWTNYIRCNSRKEAYEWRANTVQEIIDLAEEVTGENVWGQKIYYGRAICPLCGDRPHDKHGYTIPEGLKRHLEGFGNMQQCSVMGNLFNMARECWNKKFIKKEHEDLIKEREVKEQRLKSETLIQIAPGYPPELFDDSWDYGSRSDQKQHLDRLIWAENRLNELGFSIQVLNNVKSFTKEYDEFVVFADPRRGGLINFSAFKKPLPKKITKGIYSSTKYIGNFNFLDGWKHDLISKFEKRVRDL
jgi:hypothetical protein